MKTIMIVDDDPDSRGAMAAILGDAGFHVIECDNGLAALSRLVGQTDLPDTIVLDLAMPIMSGHELLKVLRGYLRLASVPIIIVTGAKEPIEPELPVVAYVTKPYEPSALVQLVNQAVA